MGCAVMGVGSSFRSPEREHLRGSAYLDLRLNQWRGFAYNQGAFHPNPTQNFGNAAQPNINTDIANGYRVIERAKVAYIHLSISVNNAEPAAIYEYQLSVVRGAAVIPVARLTNQPATTNRLNLSAELDFSLLADDILILSSRKSNGSGTRRRGRANWVITLEH